MREHSPDAGFPEACASDGDTEALYRFLRNRRVSWAAILEPHLEATSARCRALGDVLVIHDTTEMSFPGEQPRTGLTPLGPQRQGFWWHTALAVSTEGVRAPVGLIAVAPFTRPATDGPKPPWRERFRDPRKESRRWADGVTAVRERVGAPGLAIHVMDREGDSYELFAALIAHGDRCVVRVRYDRRVVAANPTAPTRLSEARAQAAVRVVFGWEAHPPAGEPPVEWWLVTTEPIDTVDHVLQIVEWYRTRWLIEEFFKCLKTGCAYEKRQRESLDTLLVALALLAPIAWQLLLMRHLARELPEARATVALTARQIAILRTTPGGTHLLGTPSIRDALRIVARLGGHLRQNGEPGWLVLARGIQKLRCMETGWAAAEAAHM